MLRSTIQRNSSRAQLISAASLIIWDEAPMANRAVLQCVDDICREVTASSRPFGGLVVVLAGDFRQTCPVIRGGTKMQVVDASIKSSPLWPLFRIQRLHTPIHNAEDPDFSIIVDRIGDGLQRTVNLNMSTIAASAREVIDFVFPPDVLAHPHTAAKRAILAPTNRQIDSYNADVISMVNGHQQTYLAADSIKEVDDADLHTPDSLLDYALQRSIPGFPSHTLTVKTNGVYRLLRNFSLDRGLVKNARAVVTGTGQRLISVKLIDDHTGMGDDDILIPRISFTEVLPSKHTLLRRQFPLAPAYATTFNSCQGLTLERVGIDLTRPVFSHGQLYTACSRIRHRDHAIARLPCEVDGVENVTYHELLI